MPGVGMPRAKRAIALSRSGARLSLRIFISTPHRSSGHPAPANIYPISNTYEIEGLQHRGQPPDDGVSIVSPRLRMLGSRRREFDEVS